VSITRIIATLGVVAVLAVMILHSMSVWRRFDWPLFFDNARYVSIWHSIGAVAFIYAGFLLRAVRWRVFLRSVKEIPAARLLGPTVVGFAGLAIVGYPGELIRPCLIARREDLSVSSQLAALMLERIFDMASVGVLISAALLVSSEAEYLPFPIQLRHGVMLLIGILAALSMFILLLANSGEEAGLVLKHLLAPLTGRIAHKVAGITKAFGADLNLIRDARSLIELLILSFAIWLLIALAYLQTLHAFGALRAMSLAQALLLLGFALLGSLARLPGGGTQQLAIIAALISVFHVQAELAVSCGILVWLTIIMAPVPVGLVLAWQEGSSLRPLLRTSGWTRPA